MQDGITFYFLQKMQTSKSFNLGFAGPQPPNLQDFIGPFADVRKLVGCTLASLEKCILQNSSIYIVQKMCPSKSSTPGKIKWQFWAKFHLFSAHFLSLFHLWDPIRHFSAQMFTEFAYFCLFLPIFRLFST